MSQFAFLWLPRSSVGAIRDAPASRGLTPEDGPLERPDCIPTLERGNENTRIKSSRLR